MTSLKELIDRGEKAVKFEGDGELSDGLIQTFESFCDARANAEQYHHSIKDRERVMLSLMKVAESCNIKGAPNLYRTIGKGKNRLVVLTVPSIRMIEDYPFNPFPTTGRVDISYLALLKKGIFEVFGASLSGERKIITELIANIKEDMEDPWSDGSNIRLEPSFFLPNFHYYLKTGEKKVLGNPFFVFENGKNRIWFRRGLRVTDAYLNVYPLKANEDVAKFEEPQIIALNFILENIKRESGIIGIARKLQKNINGARNPSSDED